MRAGKLRHFITIEAPTETQNEYGEPVAGWSAFAALYASREDLAGRELYAAQQVAADVTTCFAVRYVSGVTAKMRIQSDGTLYNIKSVQDADGRGASLLLIAARLS